MYIRFRDVILGLREVTDSQCGFKAFRGEAVRLILDGLRLYGPLNGAAIHGASVTSGFDVEMLFVARKLGYRIKEVPVEWDYQRTRRVNLLKDSWRGLRDLVNIRAAEIRGDYNGL